MKPDYFEQTAAFMLDHWNLITDDESAYKAAYVADLADVVRRADAGEVGWDAVLTTRGDVASHLLGWRAADHLRRLAGAWPSGLATGIRDMLVMQDADALWRAVLADAGGEAGLKPCGTRDCRRRPASTPRASCGWSATRRSSRAC